MEKNSFKTTALYGIIPPKSKQFNDFDLYENDYTLPSVFLKKIKIWYGIPQKKDFPCLLGIQCWYINYLTSEKKESEYHGCELKYDNIESKELEVNENDYFAKINIGFDYYLTHFKISTKKGYFLEFGKIIDDYEKIIGINLEDNMIAFFSGYYSSKGIRAIRIKYISRKTYAYYRIFDLLKFRTYLKNNEEKKVSFLESSNYNNLDNSMKCFLNTCLFPDVVFSTIIKYL